ncbi:hypothetical protein [Streptomyces sp. NPDC013489]|uniref:hypothetical protein n=1 Tax=Streptomyces sp. NPDC013489 TaxID=3155606 RepID=UPI0033F9E675
MHAVEAVMRPEFAHTRSRDLSARKRLDETLYASSKDALRLMNKALPVVSLHGPEPVVAAAEELCFRGAEMLKILLLLDASIVQQSVINAAINSGHSANRIAASLEDLDAAYLRLAAPMGFSDFSTDISGYLGVAGAFSETASALAQATSVTAVIESLGFLADFTPEGRELMDGLSRATASFMSEPEEDCSGGAGDPIALLSALTEAMNAFQVISSRAAVEFAGSDDSILLAIAQAFGEQEVQLAATVDGISNAQAQVVGGDEGVPDLASILPEAFSGGLGQAEIFRLLQESSMTRTLVFILDEIVSRKRSGLAVKNEEFSSARDGFISAAREAISNDGFVSGRASRGISRRRGNRA